MGSGPASLTLTFGFGASFFDRVGLATARPEALAPLPAFPDDQLDPARGGGALFVQIAADDPLAGLHALAHGEAPGARRGEDPLGEVQVHHRAGARPYRTQAPQPRGTARRHRQPLPRRRSRAGPDPRDRPGSPPWPAGGSYVVVRRIRMLLDHWDTLPGGGEHTAPDLTAHCPDGVPVIARNAHIRPTARGTNGGATMLRRGSSYYDRLRADGTPDAGMLFVAWQSGPRTGFVPVRQRLARGDALGRYPVHEASSLFVVPGGVRPGGHAGQALLEDAPQ
ncbi:Dyp-type peroxidase [Streptomyces sp. NPDC001502]|uniref:Dyp-type peroxidase n=1 Tax=Streptomyces sp. NPDC001502 TaxID=3364578 RepID=UPI00369D9D9E